MSNLLVKFRTEAGPRTRDLVIASDLPDKIGAAAQASNAPEDYSTASCAEPTQHSHSH